MSLYITVGGRPKVKSWGIIIVTALGFLMGLILAGVGVTSAKNYFSSKSKVEKMVDSYWRDADLSSKELFQLISNTNCQSSEKYFLACVNSVLQVLPKYHLVLSPETGSLSRVEMASEYDGRSEKENLQPYIRAYELQKNHRINFESIWKQILDAEPSEETESYTIGMGINGFLSVYKDPHTYILPNQFFEEVGSKSERSHLFVGISFERKNGSIFVRRIYRNSDAERSGLKEQDELLSLNGQNAQFLNLPDISTILKNSEINQFAIRIKRNGEEKELVIERSHRVMNHIFVERISGLRDYAVLTLSKFNRGVCSEVSNHIKDLFEGSVSGLVLDLRDNPGGELNEVACLAGLFIGMNKKIYSVKYFDPLKIDEVVLTTGSLLYTGPLVVLVNSSSASASELLAGALQEYNRAAVVGERTFGKGTFQEPEVWNKNSKISLFKTQGFYLLPSGASPQLKGINPDFLADEAHVQLREASNYFNPIVPKNKEQESRRAVTDFELEFKKCSSTNLFQREDLILKKGLDVLSCHRISSAMASKFSPEEFNQ